MIALVPFVVSAFALGEPPAGGVWAVAGQDALEIDAAFVATTLAGDAVVVSDLATAVVGVRPDSGLVAWTRRIAGLRDVWVLDGVVLAVGDDLFAFRADVGSRLWSKAMGCDSAHATCQARVVRADATGIWLAEGGPVQSTITRIDPESGAPIWAAALPIAHARRIVVPSDATWVAIEEGQAPFTIHFVERASGSRLGAWTRRIGGLARPVQELADGGRLGLLAVDTRPIDGALAEVIIVAPDGNVRATRPVQRAAGMRNQVVWALANERALGLLVPEPGGGQLVALELSEPWGAVAAALPSSKAPLWLGGHMIVASQMGSAAPVWTAFTPGAAEAAWAREASGLGSDVATFVAGETLVLIDRASSTAERGVMTVVAKSGAVGGIGVIESANAPTAAALGGDMLFVGCGRGLTRLKLLPTAAVRQRLEEGAAAGGDITPILKRLARFGALADGLSDASTAAPTPVGLDGTDAATLDAFEGTWAGDPLGTLEGLQALVDGAESGSTRRARLLEATARLVLAEVLAPGVVPKSDETRGAMIGLARSFEPLSSPQTRLAAALWAAVATRLDEPLVAADILAKATGDARFDAAWRETAVRSVRAIRLSAGALTTTTQREMLVAGLRFFRHLDVVLGASADRAAALMDQAGASEAAGKELSRLLAEAEGPVARGLVGPAVCALACDAAAEVCGAGAGARDQGCVERCGKGPSHPIRFVERARPLPNQEPATWFCGR